jgi:hypothetical protein
MAFAAIAFALLVFCLLWLCLAPGGDGDQRPSIPTVLDSVTVHASKERERLESDDATTHGGPGDASSDRNPVAPMPSALSDRAPGTLALRVLDNSIFGPLRWFNVRLVSDARFAEERGDGTTTLELPLTPDSYGLLVRSPGYEAVEVPRVDIASGKTTQIPSIELQPGAGSIQGTVIGYVPSDRTFTVELIGEGRHPCVHCCEAADLQAGDSIPRVDWIWSHERPCTSCGFARESSMFSVRSGDRFLFRNLASGNYAMRLSDGGCTVGFVRHLALAPESVSSIVFDASDARSVEIELFDVDGSSLSELWTRRRSISPPSAETDDAQPRVGTALVELGFSTDRDNVANATYLPPQIVHHQGLRPASIDAQRAARIAGTKALARAVQAKLLREHHVDRARTEADTLRPSSDDVRFAASTVHCQMGDNGILTVGPVPTCRLRLLVSMGRSSAELEIPESRATTRAVVYLHAQ